MIIKGNAVSKQVSSFFAAVLLVGGLSTADAAETGKLRIVTEGGFPPWNMTTPSGKLAGFDIELVDLICKQLGAECTVESQTFDAMIPAVNDGKYDAIVDALGITDARKEVLDFSIPYAGLCYSFASVTPAVKARLAAEDRIEVLTDANTPQVMERYKAAFKDATIGTLASGTSTRFVNKHLKDVGSRSYKTPAARDLDLKAGRVDVIFASKDSLVATKKNQNIEALEFVGPCLRGDLLGSGGVGIGVKKGNTALKQKLDAVLAKLVGDGTIKTLSEKHFGMDMSPVGLK
jgi:octopine/nopaline transport system substrate-binding protein